MNFNHYDLNHTVIKNGVEKEIANEENENDEKGYIVYETFSEPNRFFFGLKIDDVLLRYRKTRSQTGFFQTFHTIKREMIIKNENKLSRNRKKKNLKENWRWCSIS